MTLLASNYENDPIDVLVGDWMSEGNMTGRANAKANGICSPYGFAQLSMLISPRSNGRIRTYLP